MDIAAVKSNGRYTLKIYHDPDAESPRKNDNLGTMICWHKRYSLGDKNGFSEPHDFLANTVHNAMPAKEVNMFVKSGKSKGLRLLYDQSAREWTLYQQFKLDSRWYSAHSSPAPFDVKDELFKDAILDAMSTEELLSLVDRSHLIMPLYLYDHSGLSMSTRDFGDRWDSGQVGWIYTSHEAIANEYGDLSHESVNRAIALLTAEVKTYDHYLQGEVYGYELTTKGGKQIDSCWGFIGDFNDAKKVMRDYLPKDAARLADTISYGDKEIIAPRKPSLIGQLHETIKQVQAANPLSPPRKSDVSL